MQSARAFPIALVTLFAALVAGCSSEPVAPTPAVVAPSASASAAPAVGAPVTGFTSAERAFAWHVALKNVYEIEVSKLAVQKATSPAVRDLAETMLSQQSRMNDELAAIMKAHGVAAPKGLPADRATKLHRLAGLPRSEAFDNGYVKVIGIEDRRSGIAMFEKARRDVRDRDLRAYIDRSLAILRSHLTMAQGVAASISG
jgi:putative membrane protein